MEALKIQSVEDLEKLKKIEAGSIESVSVDDCYQYLSAEKRIELVELLYDKLAEDGKAIITVPYYNSANAFFDPRVQWPPITEASFCLFNKQWREMNKSVHKLNADFDFTVNYNCEPQWGMKSEEARNFAFKHYTNAINVLIIHLTKKCSK